MILQPDPSAERQYLLAELPQLSPISVASLKQHWIETAAQLLAASATPEGRAGLKVLIGCDDPALNSLLAELENLVGPQEALRLAQATPGGALGATLTEEQRRRAGLQ